METLGVGSAFADALVGRTLTGVCFSETDLGLRFDRERPHDDAGFGISAPVKLLCGGDVIEESEGAFKDKLCSLLGETVVFLDGSSDAEFRIGFSGGVIVVIDLAGFDGVEAAMFSNAENLMVVFN